MSNNVKKGELLYAQSRENNIMTLYSSHSSWEDIQIEGAHPERGLKQNPVVVKIDKRGKFMIFFSAVTGVERGTRSAMFIRVLIENGGKTFFALPSDVKFEACMPWPGAARAFIFATDILGKGEYSIRIQWYADGVNPRVYMNNRTLCVYFINGTVVDQQKQVGIIAATSGPDVWTTTDKWNTLPEIGNDAELKNIKLQKQGIIIVNLSQESDLQYFTKFQMNLSGGSETFPKEVWYAKSGAPVPLHYSTSVTFVGPVHIDTYKALSFGIDRDEDIDLKWATWVKQRGCIGDRTISFITDKISNEKSFSNTTGLLAASTMRNCRVDII